MKKKPSLTEVLLSDQVQPIKTILMPASQHSFHSAIASGSDIDSTCEHSGKSPSIVSSAYMQEKYLTVYKNYSCIYQPAEA